MSQSSPALGIKVAGETNVGKVRTTNEDSMIVDPALGLYVVLDGMGGANAGDIASQTARDAVGAFVRQRRGSMEPKALVELAIQNGCAAVWAAAQQSRERHGMGTTCVACLIVDPKRAVIGHAGDSRAYLWRNGRLQALTRDHTIVEELVERGMLSAEDAERHPYKNVLSRNLGSKPETKVDLVDLELKPGDRLMLCSDGLYGYASADAIQYLLGSGDAPEHVARDLVDLALRGGGGDNVTAIVIEAPAAAPSSTQVVRTSGAVAWWQRRQRFLQIAAERGLTRNPICRGLDPNEALDLIALSLCQAIFHDLEKSTGVNVWTFAQNLAGGWFETPTPAKTTSDRRRGDWGALRDLIEILAASARAVVDEIRAADASLGFLVDIAVSRALVVAELAIGGLLAERLGAVDRELIALHGEIQARQARERAEEEPVDTGSKFIDQPTIPFLRPDRPVTNPGVSAELVVAIGSAITVARARTSPRAELVRAMLGTLETIATDRSGSFAAAVVAARELYGVRSVDDGGIMPLYDALDQTRIIIASSVHQISVSDAIRASVLGAISAAHQRLAGAITGLVLEAVTPYSERLREVQAETSALRDQVARAERKRADLEKQYATSVDPSMPWSKRGTTEW